MGVIKIAVFLGVTLSYALAVPQGYGQYAHASPAAAPAPVAHAHQEPEQYAPVKYAFSYSVNDEHTGDIKEHHEARDGDVVKGFYSLVEPDGTRRIVHYTADHKTGFNAIVTKEGHAAHPQGATVKSVQPVAYAHAPAAVAHAPVASYSHAPAPQVSYSHAPAPQVSYSHAPAPQVSYSHAPAPQVIQAHAPVHVQHQPAYAYSSSSLGHSQQQNQGQSLGYGHH